jgi:nucleotide-binding universal stress UspA family protein
MECTMNHKHSPLPVITGIDGSETAVRAAQWAIDEAVSRSVPLRLVCVTKARHPSTDDYYRDIHHAEESLRAAQAAVEAVGKPVRVETAMLTGPPGAALVAESRDAEMICVGSVGIGQYAQSILGSTATELAENAHCPVAVIRPHEDKPHHAIDWIVVAVNDKHDNEAVVECAIEEAKLRDAPVLVLGKQDGLQSEVEQWKRRQPDVRVYPIADGADVGRFLKKHDEPVQLAVIGGAEAGELAQIIGPHGHPLFHHAESSALIVRH